MDDGGDKRRRTGNASAQDGVLPFGLMSLLSDILALKQIGGISVTIRQLLGIRNCAKPSCEGQLRTFNTLKVPCFVVTNAD